MLDTRKMGACMLAKEIIARVLALLHDSHDIVFALTSQMDYYLLLQT